MTWAQHFDPQWTPDRLAAFATVVRTPVGDRQATIDAFQALAEPDREWMAQTVLQGTVGLAGGIAYAVPVLSAELCDQLVGWGDAQVWSENETEDWAYRMEEVVIAHHDEAFNEHIKTVLMYGLAPYLACVFGKIPDQWNSVHLTRYSAGQHAGRNYHVDATSKYTAVIALNDNFDGGGTRLCSGVFGSVLVPRLSKGWALIFRGRDIFYKSVEVTTGTRKLLTVWSDDADHL